MRRFRPLEEYLPGLEGADYKVTSSPTKDYNCIAWALGEDDRCWGPFVRRDYWPKDLPRDVHVSTIATVFRRRGFEPCDDEELEGGFEKIAVFGEEGEFTYVALQLPSGRWTSKLGKNCDIEHNLNDLTQRRSSWASYRYGQIVGYMRRPRRSSEPNP